MTLLHPARLSLTFIVGLITIAGALLPQAGIVRASATDLSAKVVCDNSTLSVTFSWKSAGAGEQWLDLSVVDNGFAPGTFAGTGPLGSRLESIDWGTANPGITYFARINTHEGSGWSASPTLTFATPACGTGTSLAPAVTSPAMLSLQTSLEQHVAAWGFETAVAVTDLQTGETISVNGDRPHFTGCTINLLVLMQSVIDLQNGRYEESRVGDLISATIYGSNPITARDLLLISGNGDVFAAMRSVNQLIETLGLTHTFYDHPPAYPHESLEGRSNLTTALDVNRALAGLWQASVMSVEWRDYLFDKLTGVKPGLNYLIPAGVTDGTVGHKNGFFVLPGGYIDNDSGIVLFERGGRTYAYAITFLTQNVATKYADITLGQTVSSLVWQHFTSVYQ